MERACRHCGGRIFIDPAWDIERLFNGTFDCDECGTEWGFKVSLEAWTFNPPKRAAPESNTPST